MKESYILSPASVVKINYSLSLLIITVLRKRRAYSFNNTLKAKTNGLA